MSFDLQRFVHAQDRVLDDVRAELRAGRKRTHWMWFVFPQLEGLGSSPTARHYALAGRGEAEAFLAHPVLEARLLECVDLVNAVPDRTAREVFGSPDDLKFQSCATLFEAVRPDQPAFRRALDRFYGGEPDARTLALLAGGGAG